MHKARDPKVQACIDACASCYDICVLSISHCLSMGGAHAAQRHIIALMDCAEACKFAEAAMLRDSEHVKEVCMLCAAICAACADNCSKFEDDAHMQECEKACRRCAEACLAM